MKNPNSKTYRVGDDEFFQLFDTFEMGRVCNLIKESCDPAPVGYRKNLSEILMKLLLAPVTNLIHRLHEAGRGGNAVEFYAAERFGNCIENVAELLEINDSGTGTWKYTKAETEELAVELSRTWTEFIASAAAYRVYEELPKELEKAERTRKLASAAARKIRKPVGKDKLEKFRYEFEGKHGTLRGWKKAACLEYGIDSKTLNNRMAE